MGSQLETRIRHVTAVLGPTNTGKTHLAIERMTGHESGMIGLPLRLLAREVYDKIAARVGPDKVALITGEEKIKPERARYWVATVEAMPRDIEVDFLAIDEVQLAADPERGHVFTDRLLHARGRFETLLLGAQTMRDAISDLIPGANFVSRPRLSKLTYAGEKKITRLPSRSAIVAFSAQEVYAIAELIRRQRGGTAVVLGALSPRTRNAQVALYQSGEVDFLVATDAIGMGLNLDVDHVAFSALRKFDGQNHRNLTPAELGQIAGRAGRHLNDGSFGVTGSADPLEQDLIERLETHTFDPVRVLQWRNRDLDFSSVENLRESLRQMPREGRLTRARMADDVLALETLAANREIADLASTPAAVMRLWDVCQVPDYRKISAQNHAELIATLYKFLVGSEARIPEEWFAVQVGLADRVDGDIDTLANRLAHIRTWTFVANRTDWLADPGHWQGRTREVEDALSDALHELLTQKFVDRRTSALMRGLRDKEELSADIGDDGAIRVENHYVGRLSGFRFFPDAQAEGIHGKATRHAAAQVLARELGMRARRVGAAKDDAFRLDPQGRILWRDCEIGKLEAGSDPLKPTVSLLADEHLSPADRDKVQARLEAWVAATIAAKLKPLVDLAAAEDLTGLSRGLAFRLTENFGVIRREEVAEEIKSLDQTARAQLRKYGVRFGAFNIYCPALLKPAATSLCLVLWRLKTGAAAGGEALPEPPRPGLTSVPTDPAGSPEFLKICGFHVCGPRAVRIDILERLADLIRPLISWRPSPGEDSVPPRGSTGDGGFMVTPQMMSILGCSPAELSHVLKALNFRLERRPVPAGTPASKPAALDGRAEDVKREEPSLGSTDSCQEAPSATAETQNAAPAVSAAAAAEDSKGNGGSAEAEIAAGVSSSEAGEEMAVPAATSGTPAGAETVNNGGEGSVVSEAGKNASAAALGHTGEEAQRYEEIWRPRRHRDQPRERRKGHHRHARDGRTAVPANVTPVEPGAPPAAPGGRPPFSPERRSSAKAVTGGGNGDRRTGFSGERAGRDAHAQTRDRGQGKRRDFRRSGEAHETKTASSGPVKAGKGHVDPDSPFAALGALRQLLEDRAKGQGSA